MSRRTQWRLCLALALVTLALYLPALRHDFLNYDDQQYVTENPVVRSGLTTHGFVWAFGYHAGNWHPLTWLSHQLDCELFGIRAWGHHLTNVLLHTANTVLLFLLLSRMTGGISTAVRSAAVAALFGWHPLHVESVAWVAERKDVLSAFFFLLTLWAYVRYTECRGSRVGQFSIFKWYTGALFLFALALMSKPMVVTLPFVLLLLDYWPLRRVTHHAPPLHSPSLLHLLLEKAPFFALSAAACVLTLSAQQPAIVSTAGLSVLQRFEHALLAYAHYLRAIFLPHGLAVYYPYQKAVPVAAVVAAGVFLLGITALVFALQSSRSQRSNLECRVPATDHAPLPVQAASRKPQSAILVGWVWFLGMLVPVIGLVQVGDQAWADRYTYLPSVGLFIAVVWGVADLCSRLVAAGVPSSRAGSAVRAGFYAFGLLASAGLLLGTSIQLSHWKNTRTLFEHTANVTRNNPLAETILASLLEQEGQLNQAIERYRAVLGYAPGFPEAHFFLGHALDQQGKLDQAVAEYRKALWFKPIQEQTHIFLGAALAKQRNADAAAGHYLAALKLNPNSALAHNNLGKLLHSQGRLDEASRHYALAVKLDPDLAQARNNFGILLLQQGRLAEGTAELRRALRLKPADAESQLNLAQALVQQEQWSEAADLFGKVVTPATADPSVRCQYATALARLRKTREAMSQYAGALLLQPDFPAALDGLSWILSTSPDAQLRNGAQAVQMSARACELTGHKDATKLRTLAAAYAETGRFTEAAATAQEAMDLATETGPTELAETCRKMLEDFKSAKPWRTDGARLSQPQRPQ